MMIIIPKIPILTKIVNRLILMRGRKFKQYQGDKIICYLGFGVWYVIDTFTPDARKRFFDMIVE